MIEATATTTTRRPAGNSKRTGRPKLDPNESREDKFVRLSLNRMRALKRQGRLVCNLAAYPHDNLQAERIVSEAQTVAADIDKAFRKGGRKRDDFSF